MPAKIHLPPYSVSRTVASLSEVTDYGLIQSNVKDAWKATQGAGTVCLVIDSGYDPHSDLAEGVDLPLCRSFVSEGGGTIQDLGCYHSNHCCGIVGARANGFGIVGIAPLCRIVTAKVFDKSGTGDFSSINDALRYAVQLKPDVVNLSLGADEPCEETEGLLKQLYDLGSVVVCASGNDGGGLNYPASSPWTLAVGAVDKEGHITDFSCRGGDFVAAGREVYSCWGHNRYARVSGTSQACPHIAGICCLLIAKHRAQELETGQNDCKTVPQVIEHLQKIADRGGEIVKDKDYGYGIVDMSKLEDLQLVKPAGLPWNPTKWVLEADYVFDSGKRGVDWVDPFGWLIIADGVWTVSKGFEWNGATWVPDVFNDLEPKTGKPRDYYATLVHDIGYVCLRLAVTPSCPKFPYGKKEIDGFFLRLCREHHFKLGWLYWLGVRIFGRFCL